MSSTRCPSCGKASRSGARSSSLHPGGAPPHFTASLPSLTSRNVRRARRRASRTRHAFLPSLLPRPTGPRVATSADCKIKPPTFGSVGFFDGKSGPQKVPILKPGRTYTFNGTLEVPFELPAECIYPFETFESRTRGVRHNLKVTMQKGILWGYSVTQPFVVEMLSPATTLLPAERPWLSIGDCGAQLPALSRRTRLPPMHPRARTPSPARRGPHQVGRLDVRARVRWHV